jgi:hypothetical protein
MKMSSCKVPVILSDFNETRTFVRDFRKEKAQISSLIKIRPVGGELFHVVGWMDGRTDMTKLLIAFRNFANAPKNSGATSFHVVVIRLFQYHCLDSGSKK